MRLGGSVWGNMAHSSKKNNDNEQQVVVVIITLLTMTTTIILWRGWCSPFSPGVLVSIRWQQWWLLLYSLTDAGTRYLRKVSVEPHGWSSLLLKKLPRALRDSCGGLGGVKVAWNLAIVLLSLATYQVSWEHPGVDAAPQISFSLFQSNTAMLLLLHDRFQFSFSH